MFSVLMACYSKDSSVYLSQALGSIFSQTVKPDEIVLVCDGPLTYELYDVIADFEHRAIGCGISFKSVRLPKNAGLGHALKVGVEYCTQPYVVRMDADDISLRERLSDLKSFIAEYPNFDVVGAFIEEFVNSPGDLGVSRIVPCDLQDVRSMARYRNPVNHVTACIKRSSLSRFGSYESVLWFEDYFLWLKVLSAGGIIVNIPETHVYVRTDGFTSRRSGLNYIQAEFNFVRLAIARGFITRTSWVSVFFPRLVARLAPSFLSKIFYRHFRSVIPK